MDETTQRALDGDRDKATLNLAQRSRLMEAEQLIAATIAAVPDEPMPDLGPAVLRAIASRQAASPAQRPSPWAWLWRPRSVTMRLRPAYALGVVAIALAVMTTLPGGGSAPPAGDPAQVLTRFEFVAPGAHRVTLAGGFTNWQPDIELTPGTDGTWTVVVPLEPGIHTYAFVIDGERWVPDPASPSYDDGFGGQNSRLALLPADVVRQ
ncbi:MAG: hypothetical protein H0W15_06960 [Gemmatimonadales bacterium]|nr:hypothetical protein [Gemmatimonadales bacterium]